jgi:hypothetical protein
VQESLLRVRRDEAVSLFKQIVRKVSLRALSQIYMNEHLRDAEVLLRPLKCTLKCCGHGYAQVPGYADAHVALAAHYWSESQFDLANKVRSW